MKELTLPAKVTNIPTVTDFVSSYLEEISCPPKQHVQIDVAIDELFGNIANYAYNGADGDATVKVESHKESSVEITFIDSGMPYNPLEKEDPDVTLSAEERKIGGLGIFIVKKTMDEMTYKYEDGKNILTIKKSW